MFMEIDGIVFDADTTLAMIYGLTSGMQYTSVTKVDQPMANCFFASSNVVDDIENIGFTWNTLDTDAGTYKWFDTFIYGPFHLLGDTSVVFEHCQFDQYLDKITDIVSADWGLVAERAVATGVGAVLNW